MKDQPIHSLRCDCSRCRRGGIRRGAIFALAIETAAAIVVLLILAAGWRALIGVQPL